MSRILIWDLPTRLFHWMFAFAFVAAYLLAEDGEWLGWHSYFGYVIAGLALFRLVWGFVGGNYSRFKAFPPAPKVAWHYLKGLVEGRNERHLGHNPAGALAIYALLLLGLATTFSGMLLLGADQGLGPMAGWVSNRWEGALDEVHELFANAMLAVVALHLLGVAVGSIKHKENLPRSMVTGYKSDSGLAGTGVRPAPVVAVLMLVGVATFSTMHDFSGGCGDNQTECGRSQGQTRYHNDRHPTQSYHNRVDHDD